MGFRQPGDPCTEAVVSSHQQGIHMTCLIFTCMNDTIQPRHSILRAASGGYSLNSVQSNTQHSAHVLTYSSECEEEVLTLGACILGRGGGRRGGGEGRTGQERRKGEERTGEGKEEVAEERKGERERWWYLHKSYINSLTSLVLLMPCMAPRLSHTTLLVMLAIFVSRLASS